MLGRHLIESDELPDAPPVIVIGHDVWQTHFGGDRDVVGRTVHLGNVSNTGVRSLDVGFAAERYASVLLELDNENAAGMPADTSVAEFLARSHRTYRELERRLSTESAVEGVTFAGRLPRMYHEPRQIDVVEDAPAPRDSLLGQHVHTAFVDVDYFDVLGAPMLSGRSFNAADLESGSDHRVVIVNQSFVDDVLQGRNPLGRRVRLHERRVISDPSSLEPGPWYEIVGVARDLGMNYLGRGSGAGLYQPLTAAGMHSVYMAVRVRSDPESLGPRLRAVAQELDPTLHLRDFQPMDPLDNGIETMAAIYLRVIVLTSSIALLLSLAGIYSVTSFTVSRRTREIGIRVALGADARRIVLAIFSRPLAQVAIGIAAGGWLVAIMVRGPLGGLSAQEIGLISAYATLMMGVCTLACIVPARRALAIEPTEALSADE